MADRLTRIYTRTGDKGTTRLAGGKSVAKTSTRIETLGDIDELNSTLGILAAQMGASHPHYALVLGVQNTLFDLGGELAVADPAYRVIDEALISELEQQIDTLNETLPPLKEFILPGGNLSGAYCHLARTVCRRAERQLIRLCAEEAITTLGQAYLNRLSDWLFVMARILARETNEEVLWQPRKVKG